ncbi:hypothetical protein DXG01_015063 [Tephrocybe rancida]|nr:hypothetical protein DXG01_015063 [Tephrocybe rancida]
MPNNKPPSTPSQTPPPPHPPQHPSSLNSSTPPAPMIAPNPWLKSALHLSPPRPATDPLPTQGSFPIHLNFLLFLLPMRLLGWFLHTSTSLMSPKRATGAAALQAVAKHRKGNLDKAMRYLSDSDAMPTWGVGATFAQYTLRFPRTLKLELKFCVVEFINEELMSSVLSASDMIIQGGKQQGPQWPPDFFADFTSRFEPIQDVRLADLTGESAEFMDGGVRRRRPARGGAGKEREEQERGSGGAPKKGGRLIQGGLILTWFLDTPRQEAPFSVHRMALVGQDLGTEVGN